MNMYVRYIYLPLSLELLLFDRLFEELYVLRTLLGIKPTLQASIVPVIYTKYRGL